MTELNFTPSWYIKIRRNRLIKLYKTIMIILEIILILSSLIFMVTLINRNSLSSKNKEIADKIGSLVTSEYDKYNFEIIQTLDTKLPKSINYSEITLENDSIFIDFKYVDKKSYTDNLKLLEKIKGFKINYIGVPTQNEKGTYYRVGMKKDEK
ncbi:hypothetical protein [Clostridium sp. HMP27]|uniref:hypothetical protein n=1 Tax=Clostridium sp. HMP27 TaxID=1487921 RepID=UPI00052B9714|nr:hypothetical protein [Clostridium sp. HMP27]KGK86170.1 hypothetical protein DP68_15255 [Clostridium sp. HMP27]